MNLSIPHSMALAEFSQRIPADIAQKAHVPFEASTAVFNLDYMNAEYQVSHPEGTIQSKSGQTLPLADEILILHYLNFAKGTGLKGQLISFKELPDGAIYIEPFLRRTVKPLLKAFEGNMDKILPLAQKMGAHTETRGDISFTLRPLPMIPITFVLYREDEEFPASCSILFDASAPGYLPTEDYAVLCSKLVFKLCDLSKKSI